jgi:hypothetical protein
MDTDKHESEQEGVEGTEIELILRVGRIDGRLRHEGFIEKKRQRSSPKVGAWPKRIEGEGKNWAEQVLRDKAVAR